jgi:hypothetical protein
MTSAIFGQYAEHALQVSNIFYGGSARSIGMSNAFGAIGGDFSTLSMNPAGLGVYKNNEVSFTPSIFNTRVFSEYYGTRNEEFDVKLNINNFGAVFALPVSQIKDQINYVQFGIGYNRLANFNNSFYLEGFNDQSTFTAYLAGLANTPIGGKILNPEYDFSQGPCYSIDELAAATWLIAYDEAFDMWKSDMYNDVTQSAYMISSGAIDEMTISFGGNFGDKIYFGATLGIPFMSYRYDFNFSESDTQNIDTIFGSMSYSEYYTKSGVGVNGKFGVIFRPIPSLRFGAAVHTPTYYGNTREYSGSDLQSYFDPRAGFQDKYAYTVENVYDFTVTTPARLIGSASCVIGKLALISIDYEWANHASNKLKMKDRTLAQTENQSIKNYYGNQHIVRAGAEINLNKFFIRGGYGWYSSPYKTSNVNDGSINSWTCGIGYRAGFFGIDFAYQHTSQNMSYYVYNASLYGQPSPVAHLNGKTNSYMITLSFRY